MHVRVSNHGESELSGIIRASQGCQKLGKGKEGQDGSGCVSESVKASQGCQRQGNGSQEGSGSVSGRSRQGRATHLAHISLTEDNNRVTVASLSLSQKQ